LDRLTRETRRAIVGTIDPYGQPADDALQYDYSYTYDLLGNLLTKKNEITQQVVDCTYDNGSQGVNRQITEGNKSYEWDANGNLARTTINQVPTDYTFDYKDHLNAIAFGQGGGASYEYDGDGLRIQKVDIAGTINHVHDLNRPYSHVRAPWGQSLKIKFSCCAACGAAPRTLTTE
jgi:uncharacterized protein RhaS with RHS repeats